MLEILAYSFFLARSIIAKIITPHLHLLWYGIGNYCGHEKSRIGNFT
jgi:hypothetical protein